MSIRNNSIYTIERHCFENYNRRRKQCNLDNRIYHSNDLVYFGCIHALFGAMGDDHVNRFQCCNFFDGLSDPKISK